MIWSFQASGQRRHFYAIIVGTWLLVTIYAILHDQYLVRIAPEHFTVYHEPLWGIKNPPLLAAAYAFCAATIPGFALGCVCAFIAHAGSHPPLSLRQVFRGVICVIILTEIVSAASGVYAWTTGGNMLYPNNDFFYPAKTLPLVTTQTIQLTCYLTGAVFSSILFVLLIRTRLQSAKMNIV